MAIDVTAVGRVLGIQSNFRDTREGQTLNLPQRLAVLAQGETGKAFSTEKFRATSAGQVGERFGYRSPLYHIARALFPRNIDEGVGTIPVWFFPLEDHPQSSPAVGGIAASGTLERAGNYRVVANNIRSEPARLTPDMSPEAIAQALAAAVAATPYLPITMAANGTVTSAWQGSSANLLRLAIEGPEEGLTWAIQQPSGGGENPDVRPALRRMGEVWFTACLNAMEFDEVATLERFHEFGEERWGQLVRKPLVAYTGNTEADVASATRISTERRTDRTNAYLVAPGSQDLPFFVAARQLAAILRIQNNSPPTDYGSQAVPSISPGPDELQWTYLQRERAVTSGCSTVTVRDGLVTISDVVTFYRPSGEDPPGFRHVVDICKIANCIFNIDLEFSRPKWDGAALLPDGQSSTNPDAKRLSDVRAELATIVGGLALAAILTVPERTNSETQLTLSPVNPKRLDCTCPLYLSGNMNVRSFDLNFGFLFGA